MQLRLEERLADPGQVAVAENPEAPFDEPMLDAVPLAVLRTEEPDHGLCDREPGGRRRRHRAASRAVPYMGRRGSTS